MYVILIFGGNGNMGKRYQAILSHLGYEYSILDVGHNKHYAESQIQKASGYIIATPTELHADHIRQCLPYRKPILCEKPILKDTDKLKELFSDCKKNRANLSMVFQYKTLEFPGSKGESFYDYYKHGNDGLQWDCIQVIGLAKGNVNLAEKSPIWRCMLNGKMVDFSLMDHAYIYFIDQWIRNPGHDLGEIQEVHEKTAALARGAGNG